MKTDEYFNNLNFFVFLMNFMIKYCAIWIFVFLTTINPTIINDSCMERIN